MSYHAEQLKGIIQSEKESLLEKANDVSKIIRGLIKAVSIPR